MSTTLIIVIVVFIAVLIIGISIYPTIVIVVTRFFYGKYHEKYIRIHKRYTSKSPYLYCIKDDFINYLVGFFRRPYQYEIFESEKEILYGTLPFGSKYTTLLRGKGRPFCVNAQQNEFFKLKIFGYREDLFDTRVKSYYVFVDNFFILGEYSLKDPDDLNIREISHILQKKYLGKQVTNTESFLIRGANKVSVLFENNGFHLLIKYLYEGDMDKNFKMDQLWNKSTNIKFKKQKGLESELIERL
nr:hypothetical protein [Bacteroidota bacterium]